MNSIPSVIVSDMGEKIYFSSSYDASYSAAISKATALKEQGYVQFMTYETRKKFYDLRLVGLCQSIESLYFVGLKSGWISISEMIDLLMPLQPDLLHKKGEAPGAWKKPTKNAMKLRLKNAFDELELLKDSCRTKIGELEYEELWPSEEIVSKMPAVNIDRQNRNNFSKKRGPKETRYFIPAAFVFNDLLDNSEQRIYMAIPQRALVNKTVWKASLWKRKIAEKRRVEAKQTEMCEEMRISPRTMVRYADLSGVQRAPKYIKVRLSSKEVAALPKTRKEQRVSGLTFNTVTDEKGRSARANLSDILMNGLGGILYKNRRIATVFTDITFDCWTVENGQTS
jgi:hypothetical protein